MTSTPTPAHLRATALIDSDTPAVRAFAENQPVTSIVNAIRALLAQEPVGGDLWVALAWCGGILLVAYLFALRAYRKHV